MNQRKLTTKELKYDTVNLSYLTTFLKDKNNHSFLLKSIKHKNMTNVDYSILHADSFMYSLIESLENKNISEFIKALDIAKIVLDNIDDNSNIITPILYSMTNGRKHNANYNSNLKEFYNSGFNHKLFDHDYYYYYYYFISMSSRPIETWDNSSLFNNEKYTHILNCYLDFLENNTDKLLDIKFHKYENPITDAILANIETSLLHKCVNLFKSSINDKDNYNKYPLDYAKDKAVKKILKNYGATKKTQNVFFIDLVNIFNSTLSLFNLPKIDVNNNIKKINKKNNVNLKENNIDNNDVNFAQIFKDYKIANEKIVNLCNEENISKDEIKIIQNIFTKSIKLINLFKDNNLNIDDNFLFLKNYITNHLVESVKNYNLFIKLTDKELNNTMLLESKSLFNKQLILIDEKINDIKLKLNDDNASKIMNKIKVEATFLEDKLNREKNVELINDKKNNFKL